jgi:transposase-like protein
MNFVLMIFKVTTFCFANFQNMVGRKPAPNSIVPNECVLSEETIISEIWHIRSLVPKWDSDCLKWCAARRLIKNSVTCPHCHVFCGLQTYNQHCDGFRWLCNNCKKYSQSIRDSSFFAKSHLPIKDILFIMYWWSAQHSQASLMHETGFARQTVIDWYNFCRDICISWNNRNPVEIGGFDDNGHPTIVEVDETVIYKRKYQRGRCCKQRWLFGGVERSTGKCFVKFVRNRKGDTLLPIIRTHCLPGSHMITDGFTSYFTLDQIYGGIYLHSSVVHERNFVNPDDSDIHTQSIESLWSCIKYGSKKRKGTSNTVIQSYMDEFLWRRNFVRGKNPFSCLVVCVIHDYLF